MQIVGINRQDQVDRYQGLILLDSSEAILIQNALYKAMKAEKNVTPRMHYDVLHRNWKVFSEILSYGTVIEKYEEDKDNG